MTQAFTQVFRCEKSGCKIAGNHDHLESPAPSAAPTEPAPPPSCVPPSTQPEPAPEKESTGIVGLFGDVLDELAGVSESFTGKPSSLRETARKVRKVEVAGEKVTKLGQAVQNSKLPALGKKIAETVRNNTRMREYHK